MSMKLRDLIRAVRACKTAAEERAVISKECALIRTAIKEEQELYRHRNVAKLMYIHMLGYPTHFGQMECLKLISASTFPEKRIGYLALTLLLTESTEVLTLVTNSLKVDLQNSNQYIVALSLIAIGNLSTQDMARDLVSDVEKLLQNGNSYIKKKAALAMIRLFTKEPDLIEHMSDRILNLLKDRSHGVLLTGIELMNTVLHLLPSQTEEYRRQVPSLVRLLRNFISMGYSPEHDVGGITDPFVQVKLLNILRNLGKGNVESSDLMNDVLTQVATNTETAKNAGNAILYECVLTIMGVESDSGLRVLAINILGRFLLNRDNNIRYVALNTLSKVVYQDMAAVQRHRHTIVDCLKDSDVSIRQRALELIYQLVNEQNVEQLMAEMLNYLVVAHTEHKVDLVTKIMSVVEKYSPNHKWRVDTIITMLSLAGNQTDENVVKTAIIFISQAEGLHSYAVHRLFKMLQEDTSQISLVHVGIWCIGEYGDLLTRPCTIPTADFVPIDVQQIVSFLDHCLRIHNADAGTKSLVLNALIKLSVRVPNVSRKSVLDIFAVYKSSLLLELQQRSVEYATLLGTTHWDNLRSELLAAMPVVDEATFRKKQGAFDDAFDSKPSPVQQPTSHHLPTPIAPTSSNGSKNTSSFLLDLDDIFSGNSAPVQQKQTPAPSLGLVNNAPSVAPAQNNTSSSVDLLNDIFSLSSGISTTNSAPVLTPSNFNAPPISTLPIAPVNVAQTPSFITPAADAPLILKAFEKGGLLIMLEATKTGPQNSTIVCKFSNQTTFPMSNLVFQAAVPKYLKLEMLPPSNTIIAASSTNSVTQEIKITNSSQGEKAIMLKLKISYSTNGRTVEEVAQVSSFPPTF